MVGVAPSGDHDLRGKLELPPARFVFPRSGDRMGCGVGMSGGAGSLQWLSRC